MRKICILLIIFTFAGIVVSEAIGNEKPGPMHKLNKGLSDSLCFWNEIPKSICEESKKHNVFAGSFYGLFKGTGKAVTKLFIGLYEIITFSDPPYQPSPESNKPESNK